jgi:hypothetical protein
MSDRRRVTLHLTAQATVEFTADELWPSHGDYSRYGPGISAFAQEITRRLQVDGYVGCSQGEGKITVIPLSAIKRIDFHQG